MIKARWRIAGALAACLGITIGCGGSTDETSETRAGDVADSDSDGPNDSPPGADDASDEEDATNVSEGADDDNASNEPGEQQVDDNMTSNMLADAAMGEMPVDGGVTVTDAGPETATQDDLCNPDLPPPPDCDGPQEFSWAGHCYKHNAINRYEPDAPGRLTWPLAQQACAEWGGTLWTVSCTAEMHTMIELLPPPDKGTFWMVWTGGNDRQNEGEWVWDSGEPWNDEFLPQDEIEDGTGVAEQRVLDCLMVSYSTQFNDGMGAHFTWVCEGAPALLDYICER